MKSHKGNASGPRITHEQYRLRGKQEIKQYSDVHSKIKKGRLKFYGHIERMDAGRLAKRIVELYETRKAKAKSIKWTGEIKYDLKLAEITREDVQEREIFRSKIHKRRVEQEEGSKKNLGSTRRRKPARVLKEMGTNKRF